MTTRHSLMTMAAVLALSFATAQAETISIEVTNNQPDIGFTFSPPWVAAHDGSFDMFDSGSAASSAIEAVAELGDGSGLTAALGASGVSTMVPSPMAPPPFMPGEMGATTLDVGDATVNRYFSYASMVVPSNDFFMGNDSPTAYELFDAAGNFLGPVTIMVYARDLWDAGTEVNDVSDGAAFLVGSDATAGTPETAGVVTPLFDVAGVDTYLGMLDGMETPIGILDDPLTPDELVATIVITPEPGTAVLTLLGFGLVGLRRRCQ